MNKISAEEIQILIISGVIGAIVGGSGLTGIVFYFIRRYLENKLNAKEELQKLADEKHSAEEKKKKDQRIKRMSIDDELQHCQGRLFFWIHKAIVTGSHNGDLEAAFTAYQDAEQKKKIFERELLAENEYE